MANPEHPNSLSTTRAAIEHQLEIVDEIENPIERSLKRDALLEQADELKVEVDLIVSAEEKPSARHSIIRHHWFEYHDRGHQMSAEQLSKVQFCMDALEGKTFEGFTDGDDWNGWACPYFTKEVAEAVLAASEKNGYTYSYDEEIDAFIVKNSSDPEEYEPEVFEGTRHNIGGEEITVYSVGAYSWIWELC